MQRIIGGHRQGNIGFYVSKPGADLARTDLVPDDYHVNSDGAARLLRVRDAGHMDGQIPVVALGAGANGGTKYRPRVSVAHGAGYWPVYALSGLPDAFEHYATSSDLVVEYHTEPYYGGLGANLSLASDGSKLIASPVADALVTGSLYSAFHTDSYTAHLPLNGDAPWFSSSPYNVKYRAGRWIGATGSGIATSDDGEDWSFLQVSATANILCVDDDGTVMIAAGANSDYSGLVIFRSTDRGATWSLIASTTGAGYVLDLARDSGGLWVGGTSAGYIVYSTDVAGTTWNWSNAAVDWRRMRLVNGIVTGCGSLLSYATGAIYDAPTGLSPVGGVDYGAGVYCAVGTVGTTQQIRTATSLGGTWTTRVSGLLGAGSVIWADGKFRVPHSGGVYTSPDGTTWTNTTPTPSHYALDPDDIAAFAVFMKRATDTVAP